MEKRPDFETLASYEEFKNTTGTVKNCPVYAEGSESNTGNQTGTESSYRRVLLREIGGKERCTAPF